MPETVKTSTQQAGNIAKQYPNQSFIDVGPSAPLYCPIVWWVAMHGQQGSGLLALLLCPFTLTVCCMALVVVFITSMAWALKVLLWSAASPSSLVLPASPVPTVVISGVVQASSLPLSSEKNAGCCLGRKGTPFCPVHWQAGEAMMAIT